jgi:outer membrane lipoprotein-sorting protein
MLALAAVASCQAPAPVAALPSVDQVLDKFVAAEGGKDAIQKVTTRASKGTIDVLTFGASGTFEQFVKSPDKTVTTSDFPGFGTVIQCYDGKTGWATDPQSGMRDMNPGELSGAKRTADLHSSLHMKEQYKKLAVTAKGKVGERDAYILEGQRGEGTEKLYFDAETGLLSRMDVPMDQGGTATVTLEDYKDVDGLKIPFAIHQDLPEISLLIKLTEVKNNVPVDDAKFNKPAPPAPAPAPEAPKPPEPPK